MKELIAEIMAAASEVSVGLHCAFDVHSIFEQAVGLEVGQD